MNKLLLWSLVIFISMGLFGITTFFEFKTITPYLPNLPNLPLVKRFTYILLTVITILAIGFFLSWYVASNISQILARQIQIKIDITEYLQKGLRIVREDKQDRLSPFEIEKINNLAKVAAAQEVKKHVGNINKEFLLWYLFTFFILGVFLFIIIIVLFLHKPSLQSIILYIFQGIKCP
jgi:cell division protein FtsX